MANIHRYFWANDDILRKAEVWLVNDFVKYEVEQIWSINPHKYEYFVYLEFDSVKEANAFAKKYGIAKTRMFHMNTRKDPDSKERIYRWEL